MYSRFILAGLAATAVSASPLNVRQAPSWSSWSEPASSTAPLSSSVSYATSSSAYATSSSASWETWQASSTYSSSSSYATSSSASWEPWQASSTYSSISATVTPNANVSQGFIDMVELASTEVDKYTVLENDPTHLVFDFNLGANPGVKPGDGGEVILAKPNTFPSLIGTGVTAAVGFLNACGLNTPHIHPRATEFLVLANGTNVQTGFILENGFTVQQNTTLSQFQGTIFPEGSIHFQFNNNCEPAVFISALSNEDAGASTIAQNFFNLDPSILSATLGPALPSQIDASNLAQFAKLLPRPFVLDMQSCMSSCAIAY